MCMHIFVIHCEKMQIFGHYIRILLIYMTFKAITHAIHFIICLNMDKVNATLSLCSVCSCVMLHSECVAAAKPLNKNPCFFPFPQNSHMRPSPPQQPVSQPSPHPQPPPPHSQMLPNQVRKLNNTKLKICTFPWNARSLPDNVWMFAKPP